MSIYDEWFYFMAVALKNWFSGMTWALLIGFRT